MPRANALFGWIILAYLAVGCASQPHVNSGSGQDSLAFRESAADVVNRAPDSMTLPQDESKDNQKIDPMYLRTQADYHFTLAESYSLEGNSARAVEEYKLTLVYDNNAPLVRLRLASEFVKQGLVSEAIEQAKLAVELDSSNEEGHLLLGGLQSALRLYDEALLEYQKVLTLNPDNMEAPMFIGALLAEQKKYAEALKYFEGLAANTKNKNRHLAFYYMGRVRMEEGRDGASVKAEKEFQQAIAAKPNYVDAVLALGQIYEAEKRGEEAIRLYTTYQEKYGPDAGAAEALGRLYLQVGKLEKAYQQFELIEAGDSENLNIKVKMAFILIEQKQFQPAIAKLEEILAKAPYSDKIRFYLGAVYEELKDFKGAILNFSKIPIASTYYVEAVVHTAYLYKLVGDYKLAVETIEIGIHNKDDQAQFYALYASFLDDLKQYKKAAEMLAGAVQKFPEHAQLTFFLGSMQDRVGNLDGTIASMQKVLKIDGKHVQAMNFLAYVYAENGRNLEDAEKLARRAIELQTGDGYIMDTLGWVLFKKGDTAEAVKVLEAAYKIQPTEAVIAEHLGDAYYKYQLPEKAKKMYLRASETETNVDIVRKLRAKIASIDQQIQQASEERQSASRQPATESH